jgi:hypothetical protein
MSSKKEIRRKRREAEQEQAGRSKSNPAWMFILGIALTLAVITGGFMLFGGGSGAGEPPWPGAVWSEAHGHWH